MSANLLLSLQITGIGMGVVFAALILLWALMEALVRLSSQKETIPESEGSPATAETNKESSRRRKAALAALAMALAERDAINPELPIPPTAEVSPWQSIMRTNMLNKRGQVK